jgi:hypothetical protein
LHSHRSSWRVLPYIFLFASVLSAETTTQGASNSSPGFLDSLIDLPVVRWFFPPSLPPAPPDPPLPALPCSVAALPPVTDADALKFEKGESKDTGDLLPAMSKALEKFKSLVTSVGGSFELKSAYRPPSYQAHLQQVWFKWMEVRNNHDLGCQTLRAQVEDEFSGHHLLETQKPVTSSDHTRGMAFDATVIVPAKAVLQRRRVTLDRLALLAGIKRPDILHDPVHFKLWSARLVTARVSTRRVSTGRGGRRA